jgi:threonyl-tRNA synthetase
MRILQIHCKNFTYTLEKKTQVAEKPDPRALNLMNVLVCFICFEKKDKGKNEKLINDYIESLKIDLERLRFKRILIYPYAHLSNSLGSPRLARLFIEKLHQTLIKKGFETYKSPFGWYKSFRLECIGHPLSEAYREF